MYGRIHLKREEERGDIDLWPPAAFLPNSSCCPCACSHRSPVGSFSSFPAAGHSSSCLGNKLYAPLRPPSTTTNALPPRFSGSLSHSYTHRHTMTGLLTTCEVLKYGRARYVQTNSSCHSSSNSLLIYNSLTECSICQLICFT